MKKIRIPRTCLLILLPVVLLILGAVGLFFTTREPNLLERATSVADTKDWDFRWTTYYWISNQDLLFFRGSSAQYPVESGWNFFKRDILTGKEMHLSALTRLASDTYGKHSWIAMAPDGQRLFWTDEEEGVKGILCATLEGQHFQTFPRGRLSHVAWMGDSAHLIERAMDQMRDHIAYGRIYDLNAPQKPRKLDPPTAEPFHSTPGFVTMTNHLLLATWEGQGEIDTEAPLQHVEIYEAVIGEETRSARKYSVTLPYMAEIWGEKFSPQGDRIAWPLLQKNDTLPPYLDFLHRRIPAFNPQSTPKFSLWVSRIDGTQMHEIGALPIRPEKEYSGVVIDDVPDQIYWLPDGKHLSFWLKGTLYTVPAD